MKNRFYLLFFFSVGLGCCVEVYAANRGINLTIEEVKNLASPGNRGALYELLSSKQELSQWTKDALLNQAFLQHNINAYIPLIQAGAYVEAWMLPELRGEIVHLNGLEARQGYLSEEVRKYRDKLREVVNEMTRP